MILLLWGVHLIFSFLIFRFYEDIFFSWWSLCLRWICGWKCFRVGFVFILALWQHCVELESEYRWKSLSSPKGELVSADKQGKCVIWKWRDAPKSWAVFENNVVIHCNDLMYQKYGKVIDDCCLIIILKKTKNQNNSSFYFSYSRRMIFIYWTEDRLDSNLLIYKHWRCQSNSLDKQCNFF